MRTNCQREMRDWVKKFAKKNLHTTIPFTHQSKAASVCKNPGSFVLMIFIHSCLELGENYQNDLFNPVNAPQKTKPHRRPPQAMTLDPSFEEGQHSSQKATRRRFPSKRRNFGSSRKVSRSDGGPEDFLY